MLHKDADLIVALGLLLANAIVSSVQEAHASAAVAALRARLQVSARVRRDAAWQTVPARELVVGDVVRVRAGDFVPADIELADGALELDQRLGGIVDLVTHDRATYQRVLTWIVNKIATTILKAGFVATAARSAACASRCRDRRAPAARASRSTR